MKLYHQVGHNFVWNLDSYLEDEAGDGFVISPVNLDPEKVKGLSVEVRSKSLFDPQFYLPKEQKGKLSTYPFFPANMGDELVTSDFQEIAEESATECVRFQADNKFGRIVVPTRYFEAIPSDYFVQMEDLYINPFVAAGRQIAPEVPMMLTVIAKSIQITDSEQRDELLNWVTGLDHISGVYVIFEGTSSSKQIKDAMALAGALRFIHALRLNGLEVVIGYCNTEGLLYSLGEPAAISTGSYENLRSFRTRRFEDRGKTVMTGPNPRIYSGVLLQWIDYAYLGPLKELYPNWEDLFEESNYRPLVFNPEYKWHFSKPELYKHHFKIYSDQVHSLPSDLSDRTDDLIQSARQALQEFSEIEEAGVFLDGDSDGSHLPHWINAIGIHRKYLKNLGL